MATRTCMVVPYGWLSVSPSLQNECRVLADSGYEVDVFHILDEAHEVWRPDSSRIHVHPIPLRFDLRDAFGRFSPLVEAPQILSTLFSRVAIDDYDLLIGVDILGLFYAVVLSRRATNPPAIVYHFLESMLVESRVLLAIERRTVRSVDFGITMGAEWADGVASRTSLDRDNIFIVPNAPISTDKEPDHEFLHERLGIPSQRKVAVYSGSFITSHLVDELITTVSDWPSEWVLVVHGWGPVDRVPLLKQRAGSELGSRVFISKEVLSDDAYFDLIASADAGIALLSRENELKWRFAYPGKVYKYMQAEVPVIASDTPTMKPLVENNGCGICVSTPDELPDAIRDVDGNYDEYSENCLATFERFEFEASYRSVLDEFVDAGMLSGESGPDPRQT